MRVRRRRLWLASSQSSRNGWHRFQSQGTSFSHYLYTADDERILRFGNNGFHWSLRDLSGHLLREFRPEADRIQPIRDHIYRGSGLLATVNADGSGNLTQVRHQSLDHLGSPRYITDNAGNFVSEHKYYPFGEEATRSTQDDLPLKFTGHERDFNGVGEGDDLDYMHARYCDPGLGRFLSLDPVRGSTGNPQSWNRYAYVRNNPIAYVDPDGRLPWGVIRKVLRFLWKGGDAAATFGGIIEDAAIVANSSAPPTSRAAAAVSLATEVLSPITARDAKAGVKAVGGVLETTTKAAPTVTVRQGLTRVERHPSNPVKLQKQFASEQQMGELFSGGGSAMAGAGGRVPIRDVSRLVGQYGGSSTDWAKVRSSSFRARDGVSFEIHAYKNIQTGEVIELKTKFP